MRVCVCGGGGGVCVVDMGVNRWCVYMLCMDGDYLNSSVRMRFEILPTSWTSVLAQGCRVRPLSPH